ncbi:MAG: hypothetical protein ACR2H3_09055 [Acidimicrobiales bacterium]
MAANILSPLNDARLVAAAGPFVMALNLYADVAWASGISDWGDNNDSLFDNLGWQRLLVFIEGLDVSYDLAEVEVRPTWTPTA